MATTSNLEPIGAYRATSDRFIAYDKEGRTWPVDEETAKRLGIREASHG